LTRATDTAKLRIPINFMDAIMNDTINALLLEIYRNHSNDSALVALADQLEALVAG